MDWRLGSMVMAPSAISSWCSTGDIFDPQLSDPIQIKWPGPLAFLAACRSRLRRAKGKKRKGKTHLTPLLSRWSVVTFFVQGQREVPNTFLNRIFAGHKVGHSSLCQNLGFWGITTKSIPLWKANIPEWAAGFPLSRPWHRPSVMDCEASVLGLQQVHTAPRPLCGCLHEFVCV